MYLKVRVYQVPGYSNIIINPSDNVSYVQVSQSDMNRICSTSALSSLFY